MNPDIKAQWTRALRSGEIGQAKGALEDDAGNQCCLGVLCSLAVEAGVAMRTEDPALLDSGEDSPYAFESTSLDGGWSTIELPVGVAEWAGLAEIDPIISRENLSDLPEALDRRPSNGFTLSTLNDNGLTFEQIADIIEENL